VALYQVSFQPRSPHGAAKVEESYISITLFSSQGFRYHNESARQAKLTKLFFISVRQQDGMHQH